MNTPDGAGSFVGPAGLRWVGRGLGGTLLVFFVAFHVTTVVHEVLGHGVVAWAAGARIDDVYVAWAGGAGFVRWSGASPSGSIREVISWAGIVATAGLGTGLLAWVSRQAPGRWTVVLAWAVAVSAWGSAGGYAIFGLHYRYGDPRTVANALAESGWLTAFVLLGVGLHALVFFRFAQHGVSLVRAWYIPREHWRAVAVLFVAVGIGAGTMAGLNRLEAHTRERQQLRVIQQSEAERISRAELQAEMTQRAYEGEPQLTAAQQQAFLERRRAQLQPWPHFWLAYVGILLVAAVGGAGRSGRTRHLVVRSVPAVPAWLAVLALSVVGLSRLLTWIW